VLFYSGVSGKGAIGEGTRLVTVYDDLTGQWSQGQRRLGGLSGGVAVAGRWAVLWKAPSSTRSSYDGVVEVFDAETDSWSTYRVPSGVELQPSGAIGAVQVATIGTTVFFASSPSVSPAPTSPSNQPAIVSLAALDLATGEWWSLPLSQPRTEPSVIAVGSKLVVAGGTSGPPVVGTGGYKGTPSAVVDIFEIGPISVVPDAY
jgi:hypothetical protein